MIDSEAAFCLTSSEDAAPFGEIYPVSVPRGARSAHLRMDPFAPQTMPGAPPAGDESWKPLWERHSAFNTPQVARNPEALPVRRDTLSPCLTLLAQGGLAPGGVQSAGVGFTTAPAAVGVSTAPSAPAAPPAAAVVRASPLTTLSHRACVKLLTLVRRRSRCRVSSTSTTCRSTPARPPRSRASSARARRPARANRRAVLSPSRRTITTRLLAWTGSQPRRSPWVGRWALRPRPRPKPTRSAWRRPCSRRRNR